MRAQTSSKTVLAWFMLVDGVLGCFSRCGIYHSFVVQGLRTLPGGRKGEPPGGLPVFTADFPSHFYPRFLPPFLPPILQEIFPPIFTPRFCQGFLPPIFPGYFPRAFSTRHFPPAYPGSFFTSHFPVQNFHPLYRHGPDSHPPPHESAKNRTFTISAKSAMLRTQIPAPQKSSPHPSKPHPQKPLSPKGDIGGFGDD